MPLPLSRHFQKPKINLIYNLNSRVYVATTPDHHRALATHIVG